MIEREQKLILDVMKWEVTKKVETIQIKSVDWKSVYRYSVKNNICSLIYSKLKKQGFLTEVDSDLVKTWNQVSCSLGVRQVSANMELKNILDSCYENGLHPVLFKGIVFAQLYENEYERCSCDADILVSQREWDRFCEVLENKQYTRYTQKENVEVFTLTNIIQIEAHKSLWENYEGKQIDNLKQLGIEKRETIIKINACGMSFLTLGYTQQLIYHIYHLVKHFELEGIGVRCLLDMTLYVNAYYKKIDFGEFWKQIERLGYAPFVEILAQICQKYLGMRTILPFQTEINETFEDILYDFFHIGKMDENDTTAWQGLSLILPYFCDNEESAGNETITKLRMIFPKRENLPERYEYAKKYPILLPAAWAHRMIRFAFFRDKKEDKYSASKKIKKANYRIKLMKKYKLIR